MEVLTSTLRNRRASLAFGRLRTVTLAVCLALAISPMTLAAEANADPAAIARRIQLEPMLTAELQRVVNAQRRIEGQGKDVTVAAYFEAQPSGEVRLIIDLSESYVPSVSGGEMEDLQQELSNVVYMLLRDDVSYGGPEFRYGGRSAHHFFPEQLLQLQRALEGRKNASARQTANIAVVAAGHGVYYNHGFKDWRAQRDPSNGITEDFITQDYAVELAKWLNERSGVTTLFPRTSSDTNHESSGKPWRQLGARYHLEAAYPDNPDIWHSLPNATDNLRERNEDILSRPLFANYVGADAIFHLHTNAADPSATGTRVYYHPNKHPIRLWLTMSCVT